MYAVKSINYFAASWLLLCSIGPLHGESGRSYLKLRDEVDDPHVRLQSHRPVQSAAILPEAQLRLNVRKPQPYDIYDRNYYQRRDSVYPGPRAESSRDIRPEIHVLRRNATTRSAPRYPNVREESRYDYAPSRHADGREALKAESDGLELSLRSNRRYGEARRDDREMMKKLNVLDKMLSEDADHVESENTIEDKTTAETSIPEEAKRVVRQVRRQRPGFFWTLARLAFEVRDTRRFRN